MYRRIASTNISSERRAKTFWLPARARPDSPAAIGNSVEANRNAGAQKQYAVNVRLDNGEYRTIVQDNVYDLRVGNRVRIVDGRVYRY